jgi:hypothetical protein
MRSVLINAPIVQFHNRDGSRFTAQADVLFGVKTEHRVTQSIRLHRLASWFIRHEQIAFE